MNCSDILNGNPRIQDTLQLRWDEISEKDQRNLMLMMLGHNSQPSVSRKDIFEKGELEMGIPLSDGRTLILSYQADSRAALTFKLTEVSVMDHAAEREKLDSKPLEVNSLRLTNKAVDKIQEALGGDSLAARTDIVFPAVIHGPLMSLFQRTENWIEQLKPNELASIKIGEREYQRLNILGQKRRFMEFVLKFLPKKILWKAMEWGAMFGVITAVSSPAMNSRPIPVHETQQTVIAAQLAQSAQGDIATIIGSNNMIASAEKAAVFEAALRNNSNSSRIVNSPIGTGRNTEIRTTQGNDIWVLDRESGRIYLTILYQQQSGGGVQLVAPVFVEIPQTNAPQTYRSVYQLFQNTGSNLNVE